MGDFLTEERARTFVGGLITLVLSIAVHEFGHAFVADKLGDRLPREQGRVTLNPAAHIDPVGTLLLPGLPLLLFGWMGFGWGKPVYTNPLSYTRKLRMKVGHLLVAAAGPGMNILFAVVLSLILFALFRTGVLAAEPGLYGALNLAIYLNFGLAIFNLIPAPPLDGGTVLAGVLPDRYMPAYRTYAQYGFFIILAFFMIPALSALIRVPAAFLYSTWTGDVLGLPLVLAI
jgi:Zn-dependent protease